MAKRCETCQPNRHGHCLICGKKLVSELPDVSQVGTLELERIIDKDGDSPLAMLAAKELRYRNSL